MAVNVKLPPDAKSAELPLQVFAAAPVNGPILLPFNVYVTVRFCGRRLEVALVICAKVSLHGSAK